MPIIYCPKNKSEEEEEYYSSYVLHLLWCFRYMVHSPFYSPSFDDEATNKHSSNFIMMTLNSFFIAYLHKESPDKGHNITSL